METKHCYACDRKLGAHPNLVDTLEDQAVYVGIVCYRHIVESGAQGYQPPTGGPRLYPLTPERRRYFYDKLGLA